jgi:hypothetical protein
MLIIPSALVPCLAFFNGQYERAQVVEALVRLSGDVRVGQVVDHLLDTLSEAGFLEDEVFDGLRDQRLRSFAEAASRVPAWPKSRAATPRPRFRPIADRWSGSRPRT